MCVILTYINSQYIDTDYETMWYDHQSEGHICQKKTNIPQKMALVFYILRIYTRAPMFLQRAFFEFYFQIRKMYVYIYIEREEMNYLIKRYLV
jgi:hypothetical protein